MLHKMMVNEEEDPLYLFAARLSFYWVVSMVVTVAFVIAQTSGGR